MSSDWLLRCCAGPGARQHYRCTEWGVGGGQAGTMADITLARTCQDNTSQQMDTGPGMPETDTLHPYWLRSVWSTNWWLILYLFSLRDKANCVLSHWSIPRICLRLRFGEAACFLCIYFSKEISSQSWPWSWISGTRSISAGPGRLSLNTNIGCQKSWQTLHFYILPGCSQEIMD